jgi:hypothetical protein
VMRVRWLLEEILITGYSLSMPSFRAQWQSHLSVTTTPCPQYPPPWALEGGAPEAPTQLQSRGLQVAGPSGAQDMGLPRSLCGTEGCLPLWLLQGSKGPRDVGGSMLRRAWVDSFPERQSVPGWGRQGAQVLSTGLPQSCWQNTGCSRSMQLLPCK